MSAELLHPGEQPEHRCDLPPVPSYEHPPTQTQGFHTVDVLNAVAPCAVCGRLYVSRDDPDAWGFHARWVPLRWYHRKAQRAVRALNAPSGDAQGERAHGDGTTEQVSAQGDVGGKR